VRNITPLRDVAHEEVTTYQPRHGRGVGVRQSPAQTERLRNSGADFRMIARQAFADVMEKCGAIKCFPRLYTMDKFAGKRVVVHQIATFERGHIADGPDQVLVDRIMMIHVELHPRHRMREWRHEGCEGAGFVHPPQRPLWIVPRTQYLEEKAVRDNIAAQRVG